MALRLSIDMEVDAAYLRLTDAAVARTCEVAPGVLVDLDQFAMAVGVEVLDLRTSIPFDQLSRDFHIPSEGIEALRNVRPNVITFATRQVGESSYTVASSSRTLSAAEVTG